MHVPFYCTVKFEFIHSCIFNIDDSQHISLYLIECDFISPTFSLPLVFLPVLKNQTGFRKQIAAP